MANGPKEVCPSGWEIPKLNQPWDGGEFGWMCLFVQEGGLVEAHQSLRSDSLWLNEPGSNTSGFNFLPGGFRHSYGVFEQQGNYGFVWGRGSESTDQARSWDFSGNNNAIEEVIGLKGDGGSLRCVKSSTLDSCVVGGCMDPMACNYDEFATLSIPSTCLYAIDECGVCGGGGIPEGQCDCNPEILEDALGVCGGSCASDFDQNGICDSDQTEIQCSDSLACNYLEIISIEPASQVFSVNVSSGSYPSEIQWWIYDLNGELLLSGGAPFAGGQFEASCFEIVGLDSYGDGWNGAVMSVSSTSNSYEFFVEDNAPWTSTGQEAAVTYCNTVEFSDPCTYPSDIVDCLGNCTNDADGDGICDELEIPGCQNLEACNFNPDATDDDGSCLDPMLYDPVTCECIDFNWNGICDFEDVGGCTNATACNFSVAATLDDGSCTFDGMNDCSGSCLIEQEGVCLSPADFVCGSNTVVALDGSYMWGSPTDVPEFWAVDASGDMIPWGLISSMSWLDSYPSNAGVSGNAAQIFGGSWDQIIVLNAQGTVINSGEIGQYGNYLPPTTNVVEADAGEWQVLLLRGNGNVVSPALDFDPSISFSTPAEVVLADIVDIACTSENNLAVGSDGEIYVWGSSWTTDLLYGLPSGYSGQPVAVDGSTSSAAILTDLGEVRVWANASDWANAVNAYDWMSSPAVKVKIEDFGLVALLASGELVAFSDTAVGYENILPPLSFGPIVDFDMSTTGIVAKNGAGQVYSNFVEVWDGLSPDMVGWFLESGGAYLPSVPQASYPNGLCVPGCTDVLALNYWSSATEDDGSCLYGGCTDLSACNYDSLAGADDGSCEYPEAGYSCDGSCDDSDQDGVCDLEEVLGCVWSGACNYDALATEDDGSCWWPLEGETCDGACLWPSVASGSCESFAGLSCTSGALAVGPSHACGDGVRVSALNGSGGLSFGGWYDAALWSSAVSSDTSWQHLVSVGSEPLSGQLYGITEDGIPVSEPSCYGVDAVFESIAVLGDALKLDMEANHGLMLRSDGIVVSFAPGSAYAALQQTPIIFNYAVEDVACGFDFNVAVDGSQNVLYWGVPHPEAQYGYLGLPFAGHFVAIDAFGLTVAGLTDHGEVVVWGEDAGGVVSLAPSVYQEAVQVVLGEGFGVALLPDGTVHQWGTGSGSALGMPVPPSGLSNVVELASSSNQVAAYLSDGTVVHWGISPSSLEVSGLTYASVSSLEVSFEACVPGCTDPSFTNYDALATEDDGSCSNLGCTNASALNYDPWADTEDGSCLLVGCTDPSACNYDSGVNLSLRVDTVAVHSGLVGTVDLTGHVTYRLYLETPSALDVLSSVGGYAAAPLSISTTTSFWQELTSVAASELPSFNPLFLQYFPPLAYDSWVTIGSTPQTYNHSEPIYTIQSPSQSWVSGFESGEGLLADDAVGGAWFGLNMYANSVVGEDGEILLAQLTTDGELSVSSFFATVILGGDANDALSFYYDASTHGCTYPSSAFADCSGCLNDSDGDGVCDEEEVLGCTDELACNYDSAATDDDGSCTSSSTDVSLLLETVATHDAGSLAGYTTYRLYAELSHPNDRIDAVYGSSLLPLSVEQGSGLMWQHPTMGAGVMHVPEALLATDPTMAYDSYVALGQGHEVAGAAVDLLASAENPWSTFFEFGLPIAIDDVTGGGWYVLDNGDTTSTAGADLKVLLGQFTTQGGLSGTLNLQVEGCGSVGTFAAEGLTFTSDAELLGCTDAVACNYNELATTDDGSCCYEHCLVAESSGSVEVESGLEGTVLTLDPVDGVVRACLPWGCYVVRGATSVMWDGTSASGVTFGDGQLFEVGTTECLGCTDELACNYAPLAVFDDGACQLVLGDFTGDQFVGIDDMLLLLSQFQSCVPEDNCVTDVDGNGVVGVDDLLIFLQAYGTGCE